MSSPDNVNPGGAGGAGNASIASGNMNPSAPKIALVKPTDSKGGALQTHQFRTLPQQPMRVVMPSGSVQAIGTTQIIQTHIMPQAMIKQVDALGRTQISQSSVNAVSRPMTPSTIVPRGVTSVTNINQARGTIRAQTPPISTVTNISTNFVRGAMPPRTPSPAATVIPSGTWVAGNQPVQLIRASIGHSPRARIVSQSIPTISAAVSNAGLTSISANNASSQSVQSLQSQSTGTIQTITSSTTASNISGQPQAFVATLATVLPPRQQSATLVYSNPPHQFATVPGQRLAVANPISTQRQVRPIQISNTRLPQSGIGVRVSNGYISIRGPNIPVLTPANVLTSLPTGSSTTVTASNITAVAGLPAARIIQVQQQSSSGATQVLSAGRIAGNLMTLHPLVMNAATTSSNTVRGNTAAAKPSLTITHVGKVPTTVSSNTSQQLTTAGIPQGATITASNPTSSSGITHQTTQNTATSAPIGIVMGANVNQASGQAHQIAQIVNLNQPGISVGHGHQIQIIGSQGSAGAPITITSRANNPSLGSTSVTTLPASNPQIVRGNMQAIVSTSTANSTATALPIAKVIPQQQQSNEAATIVSVSSVGNTQNVYIHSRSSSLIPPGMSVAPHSPARIITGSSGTYILASSPATTASSSASANVSMAISTGTIQTVTTNSSSVCSNAPLNATTLTASYAPQAGSFAVVPASNRATTFSSNLTSTTSSQSVPVRFNPPLIVDGNNHLVQSGAIIPTHQPQITSHPVGQGSQKQTHIMLPTSGAKAVITATAPRTQVITATAARKRDQHGEILKNVSTNPLPLTKNAVKNLNSALATLSAEQQGTGSLQRSASPISRPGSSDGSTTVSAHSSPGADRQEQEEINSMNTMHRNNRNIGDGTQFATSQTVNVPEMQAKNSAVFVQVGHIVSGYTKQSSPSQIRSVPSVEAQAVNRNGANEEITPRKRARKQQLSEFSNANIKKYQSSSPASAFGHESNIIGDYDDSAFIKTSETTAFTSETENSYTKVENVDSASSAIIDSSQKSVDVVIKKPKTCTLLDGYKQTWKATNNHFQRYSDVKPREERRPTVVDLANQAHVLQKVNGWKIYHLSSQMEDLTELEIQVYDKLSSMLQCMEAHNQSSEVDRVKDLIKGNMQRSKIVSDSINEARLQILKVFDHKSHVSDIIHRCASKRNFKKKF